MTRAQEQVKDILAHLETDNPLTSSGHSLNGTDEPCRIYLTCYKVKANDDPRAYEILNTAHSRL